MRGPDPRPRTRGTAGKGLAYRVKKWRHSPSGGAWFAVMASVDGGPSRLIGVELGREHVGSSGWSEVALRAAVEAKVAELNHKGATLASNRTI